MKHKEKIPFSEDTAKEIVEKYNLNKSVIKVWRNRGHIPGAYQEQIDTTDKISLHDPEYQKFIEILQRPEISTTKFRTLGIKGNDISRGKSTMTESERIGFKTEIVEIRNKLRLAIDHPTDKNIKSVFLDVRFHPTKFVEMKLYKKVMDGFALLTDQEKQTLRFEFVKLNNNLKV